MHTLLTLAGILVAAFLLVSLVASRPRGHQLTGFANTQPANWGVHAGGKITMLADAAITTRYKLVKIGTDAGHVAVIAATADEPLGVCNDEPAAAEDPVTITMLGAHASTVPMVAGGAITDGAVLYTKADGTVTVKPTAAGTYWKVGTARGVWSSGEVMEVIPCKPRKLIVVAALTQTAATTIAGLNSTAVNPTKADYDLLLAEAGKLQADFYVLKAALNGDADVAWATS